MRSMLASLMLTFTFAASSLVAQGQQAGSILPAGEVERLMPSQVFYRHQSATTQLRNSAAIRFSDGNITLAGLVDTSGYSSAERDTYQFYLLTDVAIEAGGKRIAPGAYGCGFVNGKGLVVLDLGGNELFSTPTTHDAAVARPRPLQILAGDTAGVFKLYLGRDYIALQRAR